MHIFDILSYPKFIRRIVAGFFAVISLFLSIFELPTIPHGKELSLEGYQLVWNEEFNGTKLDTTKWTGHYGSAGSTYMRRGGYWNTDFCKVSNGYLHIETKYMPEGYKNNGKPGWYTSGIDTSKTFSQCRGYFETRCILPKGVGLWSAFWVYTGDVGKVGNGGTDGAEIDVFESPYYCKKGSFKNSVTTNVHYDGYDEAHKKKNVARSLLVANNPYEEFNTYGLMWTEDEYIFYINGVEIGRSDFGGVSNVPEYMILSVEVGGDDSVPAESWAGPSIENNRYNEITDFVVDYVRVYKVK